MVACNVNVAIIGFGNIHTEKRPSGRNIRNRVNEILVRDGNAKGSITTMIDCDVKCAEHTNDDEPYLRVYSDDERARDIARTLCDELKLAVEFIILDGVFIPSQ